MFCFLVTHDHVADDDLSDAGYFHIEGPRLSSSEVVDLHVRCLNEGTAFRLCANDDGVCYEGKLCNAQGAADHACLLQWAREASPACRLAVLDAQQQWVELRA